MLTHIINLILCRECWCIRCIKKKATEVMEMARPEITVNQEIILKHLLQQTIEVMKEDTYARRNNQ